MKRRRPQGLIEQAERTRPEFEMRATNATSELLANVFRPVPLAFCDYIADTIKHAFQPDDSIVESVGPIKCDLHPVGGYMLTTKKTLSFKGRNGKDYLVTVEEAPAQ